MRSRERKKEEFREGIEKFEKSSRNADDYMELILSIRKASSFGDGLVYPQLKNEIEEVLKNMRVHDSKHEKG
ncbi:hypothetical protein AT268_31600 [Bacillus cereus]|uniref:Uncharacterized protein n=1 Tax=Bacillus cereus TaxID=1396 RepID=A0A9X0SPA7_BACCE|nr:hypothetical protein [Bacillus cereus]KXY51050.1 hypothetical protein AT268_31600 [Bacillus cereus]